MYCCWATEGERKKYLSFPFSVLLLFVVGKFPGMHIALSIMLEACGFEILSYIVRYRLIQGAHTHKKGLRRKQSRKVDNV